MNSDNAPSAATWSRRHPRIAMAANAAAINTVRTKATGVPPQRAQGNTMMSRVDTGIAMTTAASSRRYRQRAAKATATAALATTSSQAMGTAARQPPRLRRFAAIRRP